MEYLIQAKQLDCVSFPSASVGHSDPKMPNANKLEELRKLFSHRFVFGGCVAFMVCF